MDKASDNYLLQRVFGTPAELNDKLKILDEDENVILYGYSEYSPNLPVHLTEWRSVVVVKGDTGTSGEQAELSRYRILFKGFPFSTEFDDETIRTGIPSGAGVAAGGGEKLPPPCSYKWYPSFEGTFIKIFNVKNRWYTSTNRNLDAFRSKWASRHYTFGNVLARGLRGLVAKDAGSGSSGGGAATEHNIVDDPEDVDPTDRQFVDDFCKAYLRPDEAYFFMLKPIGNDQLVCISAEPYVTHTATLDLAAGQLNFEAEIKLPNGSIVPKREPTDVADLRTWTDIGEFVNRTTDTAQTQGIIGFLVDRESGNAMYPVKCVKIVSRRYNDLCSIRNNIASLPFCWLTLRAGTEEKRQLFKELYPHMSSIVDGVEREIYAVCKSLHRFYISVFVHKRCPLMESKLPAAVRTALKLVHGEYLQTFTTTNVHGINDRLCSKPSLVNKLLKIYRTNGNSLGSIETAAVQDDRVS